MVKKTFLRRTWNRYSKLGRNRKKKQVWRRPTGRDNKMREKRKGYPSVVSIGYKKSKKDKKKHIILMNPNDIKQINKSDMVIMGNIGKKKKIEIAKLSQEKRLKIQNLNVDKFLKQVDKQKEKTQKSQKKEKPETKPKKKNKWI